MSGRQSAARKRDWEAGKYRHRKQVQRFWAQSVVWYLAVFQHNPQAVHRIRWAIARDQLRSE